MPNKQTQAAEAYMTAVDRLKEKLARAENRIEHLEREKAKLEELLANEVRLRQMDFDHKP